jgi:methanethiol S-methyltransferase
MVIDHFLLGFFWTVYCVLHSVLASLSFKRKAERWMGSSYKHYRLLYTIFAFVGLVAIVWFQVTMDSHYFYSQNIITNIVGAILGLSGIIIMGICISKYFLNLSGLKSLAQETNKNQLLVTGIHRYIRHPLYLGTFLFIWGLLLLFPLLSLLISNSIITIYTLVAIKYEEEKLIAEFGEDYRQFQRSVPKILPSLKFNRGL